MDIPISTMKITKIPFAAIPQLSHNDKSYAAKAAALRPFFKYLPTIDSFGEVIADKSQATIDRDLLVQVLKEQYSSMEVSEILNARIESLKGEKAFTVVTAHQPSLFTGPLYYIFKIITTINLASQLAEKYPDYDFVPVFVTGGEDHDFAEVNHANIFNKQLKWESGESGSVGKMSTASLKGVLEQLEEVLGESDWAKSIFRKIEAAYTSHKLYSSATVDLVNKLFGEMGLVVLNMNHHKLKKAFLPYLRRELFERPSKQLVETTAKELAAAGFNPQATPRAINLFYLDDQIRERIVWEENRFKVLNTSLEFSVEEMEAELQNNPERFSPNVIMRPLYQEVILPNLAYVGGGGELSYWLERKSQFEFFGVNFPVLLRRNSAMWLDASVRKRREKLGLEITDLFGETESLIKQYVQDHAEEALDFSKEETTLTTIFDVYREKAEIIDPTLVKAISAEEQKQKKVLSQLAGRLHRAEKQKHEIAIKQIRALKEKLFPNNGLQERKDNFLSFYLKYGEDFFTTLLEAFDPFDSKFVIIEE